MADKVSLGVTDKAHQELFAGDQVQVVNGPHAGTRLYKIQLSGAPYMIVGQLSRSDASKGTIEIAYKKVRRVGG